jgi:hypothetical protein
MNRDNTSSNDKYDTTPSSLSLAKVRQEGATLIVAALIAINQPFLARATILNRISSGISFALNGCYWGPN